MKKLAFLSILMIFAFSCQSRIKKTANISHQVMATSRDSVLLDSIFHHFSDQKGKSTATLVAEIGKTFLGTAYVEHTLENGQEEKLVVNLRGLDCTTFAENCLAIARTIRSVQPNFDRFTGELEKIRYRQGIRDGYCSRLHYFSDWIYDNREKGLILEPAVNFGSPLDVEVGFMSAHPNSYAVLKENPELVPVMAEQENEISARTYFFLKKEAVEANETNLREGDIVGIVTTVGGLDVAHVGILVKVNGRIHLMHASSASGKVVISDEPLSDWLLKKKSYTGIMIARPE